MAYDSTTGWIYCERVDGKWQGVSVWDVAKVLGMSTGDVGALCTSRRVNKWSRCKPVRCPGVGALHPATRYKLYGTANAPSLGTGFDLTDIASQNPLGLIADHVASPYLYLRPQGGAASPYRLTDFEGYVHTAVAPMKVSGFREAEDMGSASEAVAALEVDSQIAGWDATTCLGFTADLFPPSVFDWSQWRLALAVTDADAQQVLWWFFAQRSLDGTVESAGASAARTQWQVAAVNVRGVTGQPVGTTLRAFLMLINIGAVGVNPPITGIPHADDGVSEYNMADLLTDYPQLVAFPLNHADDAHQFSFRITENRFVRFLTYQADAIDISFERSVSGGTPSGALADEYAINNLRLLITVRQNPPSNDEVQSLRYKLYMRVPDAYAYGNDPYLFDAAYGDSLGWFETGWVTLGQQQVGSGTAGARQFELDFFNYAGALPHDVLYLDDDGQGRTLTLALRMKTIYDTTGDGTEVWRHNLQLPYHGDAVYSET